MNRLTQTGDFENPLDSMIDAFFHTFEKRVNVFIVDDTLYERNRSKHVELLSWVLDHTKNKFVKGFRLLTLAWSDGNSLVPISGRFSFAVRPEANKIN